MGTHTKAGRTCKLYGNSVNIYGLALDHLSDLIQPYVPPGALRSMEQSLFSGPKSRLKFGRDQAFSGKAGGKALEWSSTTC